MTDKELENMFLDFGQEIRLARIIEKQKKAQKWEPSDAQAETLRARNKRGYSVLAKYETNNQVQYWK